MCDDRKQYKVCWKSILEYLEIIWNSVSRRPLLTLTPFSEEDMQIFKKGMSDSATNEEVLQCRGLMIERLHTVPFNSPQRFSMWHTFAQIRASVMPQKQEWSPSIGGESE